MRSRLFCFCAFEASCFYIAAVFRHALLREKTGLENPQIFQTCK